MKVTTAAGCTYQLSKQVPVYLAPTASFSPDKTTGAYPLEVELINTSTGATHFRWSFATGQVPLPARLRRFTASRMKELLMLCWLLSINTNAKIPSRPALQRLRRFRTPTLKLFHLPRILTAR
jgi:hypothetical protein